MLTLEQRERRLKYLGYDGYDPKSILRFQKKAFPNNKSEWDGKWGPHTDRAARTFYNVKRFAPDFKPEEFKCTCGHCNGYPSFMKKVELQHIQKVRDHYGKPVTVTSGLRCSYENARVGGVRNSGHTRGYAIDFYIPGVTDTVAHRTKALRWIEKLPNHEYTYGKDMRDSNGVYKMAIGMGNAMHTETHAPEKTPQGKICAKAKEIAASGKYRYMYYSEKYGAECPICHPHGGKNDGFQCIGYAVACWHHSGIPCKCRCDVMTDQIYNRLLKVSMDEARKTVRERFGIKEIDVLRNGGKAIPASKLKPGDMVVWFTSSGYKHTGIWIGNGKIADCTHNRKPQIKYGAPNYKGMTIKLAFRYTGR